MNIDKSKHFKDFFDKFDGKREIDFLVLHHVEAKNADHAIEQFVEYGVSSHFVIEENGQIFELVSENDIAYHAGVSYWGGVDGLNKKSIGIEFINSSPFTKNFALPQLLAGVNLCKYLIQKYRIKNSNIVGHSDIAYSRENSFLDRKQDPSHLFNWEFFSKNSVGLFPQELGKDFIDKALFLLGAKDKKIVEIKNSLKRFGYRLVNLNDEFDQEMQALVRVFNRRFNQRSFKENSDIWYLSSQLKLENLLNRK